MDPVFCSLHPGLNASAYTAYLKKLHKGTLILTESSYLCIPFDKSVQKYPGFE